MKCNETENVATRKCDNKETVKLFLYTWNNLGDISLSWNCTNVFKTNTHSAE